MVRKVLIVLVGLSLVSLSGFAQGKSGSKESRQLENEAKRLDLEARHEENKDRVFESLSSKLGIPVDTLKSQQESTKFGYGQLFIANALAKETGKEFEEIAAEFAAGNGFGSIAKKHNVKVGKIVSQMRKSTNELQQAHESEMKSRRDESRTGRNREEDRGRGSRPQETGRGMGKSQRRGP